MPLVSDGGSKHRPNGKEAPSAGAALARSFLRQKGEVLLLEIVLAPRASKERMLGVHGGRLKIAVTAPPVDGKANKAVCEYLAKLLGVSRGNVSIELGHGSREKVVRIEGCAYETAAERLDEMLPDA